MKPTPHSAVALDETEWLTIAQAADRLGVSERTVHRYADDPNIPIERHAPLPGLVRLRADEVDAVRRVRLGGAA
jgi:excisionase family DNA binding protein